MHNKNKPTKINKLLVANRGEIAIRVLRAASELNIRTVAIYTFEDRYSLHRYKADESYPIGSNEEPLKPYLDIEEIISVAKKNKVDAIHPGYGFLSENVAFARRCEEEKIIFIGPSSEVMQQLGDKVRAKKVASLVGVPMIPDSKQDLTSVAIAKEEAQKVGYPIMLKAAAGGGGRGMRVIYDEKKLDQAFNEAKNESLKAFGDDTLFIEKFIEDPKHIEVQILGDNEGNIVHLFERDCSVQRRFQKVVEIAPSILPQDIREKLYQYALAICNHVKYNNAGTVEFLVDKNNEIYFIEVNPRIQVEHTITEEITGIDIVRTQIMIAAGLSLSHKQIFIHSQDDIQCHGWAIQCRITTEDPENNFTPDYGTLSAYRNAAGFGIRLDEGSSYPGVTISPFFDSMLVKVSAHGRTLEGTTRRILRALSEFRIRGVKTNIPFLMNVMENEVFRNGEARVSFIESNPELLKSKIGYGKDRGTKTIKYLAELKVNGHPDIKIFDKEKILHTPNIPDFDRYSEYPKGSKNDLTKLGREQFVEKIKTDKYIHYTDTTLRDAHQSLFATRMRMADMLPILEGFAKNHAQIFSLEVWGGATFDVCMRFLHEDPWERLRIIREKVPNILLQMLLRGSNAVGYKAYPNNLIEKFIEKSSENGIDIFRIFDSLNWLDNMKFSIKTVLKKTNALAEVCIDYTGDILNPEKSKYNLEYYIELAKRIEGEGAHILAIKDMAGLLKPYAAEKLITELKKNISIPIHLHTHDTSSIQAATYIKSIDAGVDIIDVALASMSGLTSQPNFNSIVAAMEKHPRENKFDLQSLNEYSNYFEKVREYYYPFESELKAGTAEVYDHEIPGGQYSNLLPQARGLGLESKFEIIKKNYIVANKLFGDIVKVTPSSKVVGDMAMYMTANELTEEDIFEKGPNLSFPDSVKQFLMGDLGQPYGGFPKEFQKIVLKDAIPFTDNPNEHLEPIDFESEYILFQNEFGKNKTIEDFLSYQLYPKVYKDFNTFQKHMGEVRHIPTPAFYYPMKSNEEIIVSIEEGKNLLIRYRYMTEPNEQGEREVFFQINGQTRNIRVKDQNIKAEKPSHAKLSNNNQIGSGLQGKLVKIFVNEGDVVTENQPLFVIEAMKMESTITSTKSGKIKKIFIQENTLIEGDDCILELE